MKRQLGCLLLAACSITLLGPSVAHAEEQMVFALPNNTFEPSELTIVEGDTVTWTNSGGFHNVRADDDAFRCADGCDGTGGDGNPSTDAWSFSLVFTDVGLIPYYCEIHGAPNGIGMSGTVEVMGSSVFEDGFESGDTAAWSVVVP